jgi:hypothetical protein
MIELRIIMGLAVLACGLGLAYILFGVNASSGHAGPQVYDLTDSKFDKINAPRVLPFGGWVVDDPGPVRIDMPYGVSISGKPTAVTFGETSSGRGLTYHGAGQRFSDAYQQALTYCERYGCNPKLIIEWHDQGKGRPVYTHASGENADDANVQIVVDVWNLLPPPEGFSVSVSFGWPKTFDRADAIAASKPSPVARTP